MGCYQDDAAARRYMGRMLFTSIFYVFTVFGINWLADRHDLATASLVLLAVLPVIPAGLMLASVVAFIRSRDELYQRVFTEAALVSAGVVGLASFTWGFIESVVDVPDVSMVWILPALIALQGFVAPLIRRRYQ